MIHYCVLFGYGGEVTLNTITIDLTHVNVLAEDGSNKPLVDQHFHAHSYP
jgi:hypothetical protein